MFCPVSPVIGDLSFDMHAELRIHRPNIYLSVFLSVEIIRSNGVMPAGFGIPVTSDDRRFSEIAFKCCALHSS